MNSYYRTLVCLSGLGFLASFAWNVLTLIGIEVPKSLWMPLVVGIFFVWVPAVVSALPLNDRIADDPWHAWKILLEGTPTWMYVAVFYIGIYSLVNWVLATGGLGRVDSNSPAFPRAGSGITMLFYATAMAILYSSGARANATQCPEGHFIYPGQRFCSVCGPPRARQGSIAKPWRLTSA